MGTPRTGMEERGASQRGLDARPVAVASPRARTGADGSRMAGGSSSHNVVVVVVTMVTMVMVLADMADERQCNVMVAAVVAAALEQVALVASPS